MQRIHKVAIARIFSDLIKADRIVDTGEMKCWNQVCAKYAIDKKMLADARDMSLSQALATLCQPAQTGLREDLLGDCRAMTVSDGFCAHSEALLLSALMLMLDSSQPFSVETISIPRASFNIDLATALYVESDYDAAVNEAIDSHYRTLFKEFQLAGFHFVYPPRIIDHYRDTEPALFRDILSFLAPSLSEEGIENAASSLMNMTTAVFCKDLLCNKCGINDLRNTFPALLIKIGNSFVGEVAYADYLKIEVGEDILATVQTYIDIVCSMLTSDVFVVSTSEERDNQFHFHGFYKQLLDIFLIRKNIRSRVVINPYREEILFPDIDAHASGLHRRERALYALLLCAGPEGLNFNPPSTATDLARFNKRMATVQARYQAIYSMFGGDSAAPNLSERTIRGPIVSCLKRSIGNLKSLYNQADYNVTSVSRNMCAVHVDPSLVYVADLHSSTPVPLKDSELYRRYQEA